METIFATHCGGVRNTAVVSNHAHPVPIANRYGDHHTPHGADGVESGLGGQLGEVMASLNAVGWNHNKVPDDERIPPQEKEFEHEPAVAAGNNAHASGLGGQIGELVAALDQVGWNHNQVPTEEKLPFQERV